MLQKLAFAIPSLVSLANASVTCPSCWTANAGGTGCVPEASKFNLDCSGSKMTLTADVCIVGTNDRNQLKLDTDAGCASTITKNAAGRWEAMVPLDCAKRESLSAADGNERLKFSHKLTGGSGADDGDALISFLNQNTMSFSCTYKMDYEISDQYVVESSVVDGTTDGTGEFDLTIKTYRTDKFIDTFSGVHRVGDQMHFAVVNGQPIDLIHFTTLSCTVSATDDPAKTYDILKDGCYREKNLVNFKIIENYDKAINKFSYKVFEFRNLASKKMKLTCNVRACATGNTFCQQNGEADCTKPKAQRDCDNSPNGTWNVDKCDCVNGWMGTSCETKITDPLHIDCQNRNGLWQGGKCLNANLKLLSAETSARTIPGTKIADVSVYPEWEFSFKIYVNEKRPVRNIRRRALIRIGTQAETIPGLYFSNNDFRFTFAMSYTNFVRTNNAWWDYPTTWALNTEHTVRMRWTRNHSDANKANLQIWIDNDYKLEEMIMNGRTFDKWADDYKGQTVPFWVGLPDYLRSAMDGEWDGPAGAILKEIKYGEVNTNPGVVLSKDD